MELFDTIGWLAGWIDDGCRPQDLCAGRFAGLHRFGDCWACATLSSIVFGWFVWGPSPKGATSKNFYENLNRIAIAGFNGFLKRLQQIFDGKLSFLFRCIHFFPHLCQMFHTVIGMFEKSPIGPAQVPGASGDRAVAGTSAGTVCQPSTLDAFWRKSFLQCSERV